MINELTTQKIDVTFQNKYDMKFTQIQKLLTTKASNQADKM